MTNLANRWAGHRKKVLLRIVSPNGTCQHRGCNESSPSKLRFSHVRTTPLSRDNRGHPRGRKEKWADINKYPKSYRVKCAKHDKIDSRNYHSRLIKDGIKKSKGNKGKRKSNDPFGLGVNLEDLFL